MTNENYEQWFKMSKNMGVPFAEWNKLTTDILKRITAQNLEIMGENYSLFSDRLKRLCNIKKPEDFLNLQKEILHEDVTLMLENIKKSIHLSMETMDELTKFYSGMTAKMTEKTVEKVKKYTERSEI